MQTVHIMTGLPGSGKTTHARELNAVRLNLDDYRAMLGDRETWDGNKENLARRLLVKSLVNLVDMREDVVIDNTHLGQKLPGLYRRALALRPVRFEVHDLTGVPVKDCVERDLARPAPVGEEIIRQMWSNYRGLERRWKLTSEWMNEYRDYFSTLTPPAYDGELRDAVIFDIDGTLALHVARGPFDFERCETDAVNAAVVDALDALRDSGFCIVLLSGRKSEYREHTERWLKANDIAYDHLFMRPLNDARPDFLVKAELFEDNVRGMFNVEAVYDDRDQVVELWRRVYALTCLQVAYGDF
jgi:predicted kinase